MQSDSLPPADSEQERAAPSSGAGLENSVQLMDFGDGETVYITAGHVDLVTLIRRGGGVGSTWAYIPGQVLHCWLEPMYNPSRLQAGRRLGDALLAGPYAIRNSEYRKAPRSPFADWRTTAEG